MSQSYVQELQVSKVVDMLSQGNINETRERLQILSSTFTGTGQGQDKPRLSLKDVHSPNPLSTIDEDGDTLGTNLFLCFLLCLEIKLFSGGNSNK